MECFEPVYFAHKQRGEKSGKDVLFWFHFVEQSGGDVKMENMGMGGQTRYSNRVTHTTEQKINIPRDRHGVCLGLGGFFYLWGCKRSTVAPPLPPFNPQQVGC